MTPQVQILQRLCVHLGRLAPERATIHPDIDLVRELGLDSIQVMNLLMEIEDEFDVTVPLNVLADVRTPAQLARAVGLLVESGDGAVR